MRRICVFAGSRQGSRPEYKEAAQELGREMAGRGIGLVYGGASVGLMGALADEILAQGGEAIGVIPKGLFIREIAHQGLTELHQVKSMHERKALMADLSDGFIALPGGFGTFDELFEITTWAQIGLHTKPIGLLNVSNFFEPLMALVQHASREGFIAPIHTKLLLCNQQAGDLLDTLEAFRPDEILPKWDEQPLDR